MAGTIPSPQQGRGLVDKLRAAARNAEEDGVAVIDIAPNSPVADFGFQPRDIVRR
jgi:hypothetical protein